MDRILISACLLGAPVRYDGKGKLLVHPLIERWRNEGRLVSFCPELAGGFQTPRPAAEIAANASGDAVLAGEGKVIDVEGADVTAMFVEGARQALAKARAERCRHALLIDGSPSCGSLSIYDGRFLGERHPGRGVTAALLAANGVEVFAPVDIDRLAALLSPA
ncbi:uncharacterized protein YbbK (DUF523 family) [Rhizobium sp. SG_E_25_P2]|uniref:DUF523 domain-containing protein n=1 Tax=Rhizobium sp. SG_E_25_P2 TaxID=2879942 RepID=UPI002476153D|nr:DUF523 domain-containing protein [Rhizobium sp. SG_E_25_P2]MDH6266542.1 uncharacterized protein YbbK (DUF523 family) [Rhizobium sp. SG_E_25_P2]